MTLIWDNGMGLGMFVIQRPGSIEDHKEATHSEEKVGSTVGDCGLDSGLAVLQSPDKQRPHEGIADQHKQERDNTKCKHHLGVKVMCM